MENHITDLERMQARIGTVGLEDNGKPWKEKRAKTVLLSDVLKQAGYDDYSLRAKSCGTSLLFGVDSMKAMKKSR